MVPWQIGHPEIHDANAIEFATQAVGPMLTAFGNKLSPQFRKDLEPHIRAAFAAMDRRNFKTPAYTNFLFSGLACEARTAPSFGTTPALHAPQAGPLNLISCAPILRVFRPFLTDLFW
jgi:hypothetical protein